MALNFFYAAHTYVDIWLESDRRARKVLAFGQSVEPDPDMACNELVAFAKSYSIIRNFRVACEKGTRLLPVWEVLKTIQRPISQEEAVDRVNSLVEVLRATYNLELLSAASKFLWTRFSSPIVIYDSLAWEWMRRSGDCPASGTYAEFYRCWKKAFNLHRGEIEIACSELRTALKFFTPDEDTARELEQELSKDWLLERIFGLAILNESYASRETADAIAASVKPTNEITESSPA